MEFLFSLMQGENPEPLENLTRYVNITDRLGRTSLHMACQCNVDPSIVQRLINDFKADLTMEDLNGQTALEYAINFDHHNLVELLVKNKNVGQIIQGFSVDTEESRENIFCRAVRLDSYKSFAVLYEIITNESIKLPEVDATAATHGYGSMDGYMLFNEKRD